MKEIKAWRTSDGETFFDIEKAKLHEDIVIENSVREKLRHLFSKWKKQEHLSEVQQLDSLAVYVVENVRDFGLAISPLITRDKDTKKPMVVKPPLGIDYGSHEMGDR